MATESSTGMNKAEMKRLLVKSKTEPVHCALAHGAGLQTGLLLMDKTKQPRALEKELTKAFPDLKNPRFGQAFVDMDIDPKLARFRINRASPGIARRLAKTLQGTGFTKVEIVLDDGAIAEAGSLDEGENSGRDSSAPVTRSSAAAAADVAAPPPAPEPGIAALAKALGILLHRFRNMQVGAEQRAALLQQAGVTQAALKAGNAAAAKAALQRLDDGLKAIGRAAKPASGPLQPTWQDAKEKVDARLEQLATELRSYDDEQLTQIADQGLFGLTRGGEIVGLTAALMDYDRAPGNARAAARVRAAAAAFRDATKTNPAFALVDRNEAGVDVSLVTTLGNALQQIEARLP